MKEKIWKVVKVVLIVFVALNVLTSLIYAILNLKEEKQKNLQEAASEIYELMDGEDNTYSKYGLNFTYPHHYKITDVKENETGIEEMTCEIKGNDLSMIQFAFIYNDELLQLHEIERSFRIRSAVQSMQFEENAIYTNIKHQPIEETILAGYPAYQSKFSMSILSIPVEGKFLATITDNGYILVLVSWYENEKYQQQVDKIIQSINIQ